jgi:hypothetical protein
MDAIQRKLGHEPGSKVTKGAYMLPGRCRGRFKSAGSGS